jgi:hypothetical protein
VNRFANFSPSVDEEIESSILRGLIPEPKPVTQVIAPAAPQIEDSGLWSATHAAQRGSD